MLITIYIYICLFQQRGADDANNNTMYVYTFPQLEFIRIHQLFRIQYTLFQLDTVNIYWWWCINICRVTLYAWISHVLLNNK